MALKTDIIKFASNEHMALCLADAIRADLAFGTASTGKARLALSGGSTPSGLYNALAGKDLPWGDITGFLVDERWVPPHAEGSNESFIRKALCHSKAEGLNLHGLWQDETSFEDAAVHLNESLRIAESVIDVAVLGMGNDGHTASWFPHANGLDAALARDVSAFTPVIANESPVTGQHLHRMTLNLAAIMQARRVYLLISGEEKLVAFQDALACEDVSEMPVAAIVNARPDMWVCWSP